jgi:hypothetical protein
MSNTVTEANVIFGKIWDGTMLISRHGLFNGECNSAFAAEALTFVSQDGNTITVQESGGQHWVNRYDATIAGQPEWIPFDKAP